MSEQKELKFVRLKNSFDDIVGHVTFHDQYLTVEKPLVVDVETIFEEGRQILSIREYLPQSIISMREVDFNLDQVLFTTPVREDFKDQYEQVATFFYDQQAGSIEKPKKRKKVVDAENVVSLLEALRDKKDKPVH
jgi:hypothetical protein